MLKFKLKAAVIDFIEQTENRNCGLVVVKKLPIYTSTKHRAY